MRPWLSFRTGIRALDLKVTGANRELAQWLLDHPRYSGVVVAAWLGCGKTRIKGLRQWATNGFNGSPFDSKNKPDGRRNHDAAARRGRGPLKTKDNSESNDDFETDGGEIAPPDVLEDNILHAIGGVRPNLPRCGADAVD
jgi:hypothetical protein